VRVSQSSLRPACGSGILINNLESSAEKSVRQSPMSIQRYSRKRDVGRFAGQGRGGQLATSRQNSQLGPGIVSSHEVARAPGPAEMVH